MIDAPEKIVIVLPLPDRALSPNARVHWAAKARKVGKARRDAKYATMHAISEQGIDAVYMPWTVATAQETFYWPDKRRRDVRNAEAALKAAYDGIVDSGLLADDAANFLTHLPTRFECDPRDPRVEIVLYRNSPKEQQDAYAYPASRTKY